MQIYESQKTPNECVKWRKVHVYYMWAYYYENKQWQYSV